MTDRSVRRLTRGNVVGRRSGLLAGVAALTAALLDRATARTVRATDGEMLRLGKPNSATATTELTATLSATGPALKVVSTVESPATHVLNGLRTPDRPTGGVSNAIGIVGGAIGKPNGNTEAGTALEATGGSASSGAPGLIAVGGAANQQPSPPGMLPLAGCGAVVASGVSTDDGRYGGVGARLTGGNTDGQVAGTGLVALGGAGTKAATGQGAAGLVAAGGFSDFLVPGGDGLVVSGQGTRTGIGLLAFRSGLREGPGSKTSSAIEAYGGKAFWKEAQEGSGVHGLASSERDGAHPGIVAIHRTGASRSGDDGVALLATTKSDAEYMYVLGALSAESYHGTAALFESTEYQAMSVWGSIAGMQATYTGTSQDEEVLRGTGGVAGLDLDSYIDVGCIGESETASGGAFLTESADGATQQGLFAGNTQTGGDGLRVNGSLIVQEGIASAAVPTSQGLRRLYCLHAPVALFEDLGTAQVMNGRARVELEARFRETIDTQTYHVFLSPLGETDGVYVADQSATGFEILARRATATPVPVEYRIVARRKGLPDAHRLARFTPPAKAPAVPAPRRVPKPPSVPAILRPMAPPPAPAPPRDLPAGLA